jgi:hypothetical protein
MFVLARIRERPDGVSHHPQPGLTLGKELNHAPGYP